MNTKLVVNIHEFCDSIGKTLKVSKLEDRGVFMASIEFSEVKKGPMLHGVAGFSDTADSAIFNYLAKIRGEKLVFKPYSKDREEYIVPDNIGHMNIEGLHEFEWDPRIKL